MTRDQAIHAIHIATVIYVQPRLGSTDERWIRIAKREAEYAVRGFPPKVEIDLDVDLHTNGELYLS